MDRVLPRPRSGCRDCGPGFGGQACHQLPQPTSLWSDAGDLGFALARKGITVKSLDLLIAAYALTNGTPVLTLDRDFRLIARAGIGLQLVHF
ncbi:MAG TPA: PIN domain-containing protein [Polyangia bacterium]